MNHSAKILFASILMISASSCRKDDYQIQPGQDEARTITATLAGHDTQTKTHLGGADGKKTLWSEGDTIWISDGTRSARIQLIKGGEKPVTGYIKGTLAADESSFTFVVPAGWGSTVYAVYPSSAQDGIDGSVIKLRIPTMQTGKFGDANISVAMETENVLRFKNATAVIKFIKAPDDGKKSVYISSDKQLGGKVSVSYNNFTVTPSNPEKTGVYAPFSEGDTACYVAVAPGTGMSYSVVVENADQFIEKTTGGKAFEVNKVYRTSVKGMNPGTAFPQYSGANCFIVAHAGHYCFDAKFKGNTQEPVGAIGSVEVLWESFGTANAPEVSDIISDVTYSDDKVSFIATGNNGNAVIAVKDASGTILWSWHIWVCKGFDPGTTAQKYNNNSIMMDRNLGATSANKGDVYALGLLYQWGRKDPFLGSSSISEPSKAESTGTWPSCTASTSSTGTFSYVEKNPMQFITYNTNNYDWYYASGFSTDDTRWKNPKGKYDPCPPGWRVPDSNVWPGSFGKWTSFNYGEWDFKNWGLNFGKGAGQEYNLGNYDTIWYPAAGILEMITGGFNDVGTLGFYWSHFPAASCHVCCLKFGESYDEGYVYPNFDTTRATGKSVRCQSESSISTE